MNPDIAITVSGAFVAGLGASLHCVGMCGPLACLACKGSDTCGAAPSTASYHGSRLGSYTFIGVIAGALGGTGSSFLPQQLLAGAPWVAGAILLIWAIGWSFNLFPDTLTKLSFLPRSRPKPAVIGLLTPLIPCAPLYLMFALCALSGSAVRGGMLALAFGLGTVPLLTFAQLNFAWLQRRLGARGFQILQRVVVLLASLIVIWRLGAAAAPGTVPACHTLVP